jgi:hypothetical protein
MFEEITGFEDAGAGAGAGAGAEDEEEEILSFFLERWDGAFFPPCGLIFPGLKYIEDDLKTTFFFKGI